MRARNQRVRVSRGRGFTLVEVTFSIVIVGIAIVALMMLFASGTEVNAYGNELSTAVFLAEQMRAMTDQVSFNDLPSYHNVTYNGVDAEGNAVADLDNYQQRLVVQPINPEDLTLYIGPDPRALILRAQVSYANDPVTEISWMRVK